MTKKELEALAEKHQARADRAQQNYQMTGLSRYNRDRRNNEDLAEVMRMAANAAEDHDSLLAIRSELITLASKADRLIFYGEATGKVRDFLSSLVSTAVVFCKYNRMS